MKKLLTVSIMAVMAVTAANAEIASKAYVDQRETAAVNTAKGYTDTKIGNIDGADVAAAIAKAVTGGTENVVTHTGAVGNATTPVYITAEGVATAGTALGTMATENAADYTKTGLDTTYAKASDFTTLQSAVNDATTGLAKTNELAVAADTLSKSNKTAIDALDSTYAKDTDIADMLTKTEAGTTYLTQTNAASTYATQTALTDGLATKQNTIDAEHKLSSSLVDGLGTMAAENATDYTKSADLGTMASEAAADYTKTADLDSSATATTKQVVTGVTMADGAITVTSADPLTNAAYSLQAAGGEAGKYALTAVYDGNTLTGYSWELIQRAQ